MLKHYLDSPIASSKPLSFFIFSFYFVFVLCIDQAILQTDHNTQTKETIMPVLMEFLEDETEYKKYLEEYKK